MTHPLYFDGKDPPRDAETGEVPNLFQRRYEFVKRYCSKCGWDLSAVTVEQIMEIRSQPGWKNEGSNAEVDSGPRG